MGIVERKIRQKEETKTAILQAAWDIVTAEGWQTLSIRKIADAIEYSVQVVYSHFENKEAILLEFTREGFRLLTQRLQEAKDARKNPAEQLKAIAQAYWDFAFEQKEYYQIMFGLGIPACDTADKIIEVKLMGEVIATTLQEAIETGNNKKADQKLKFHTYWSILHGLVSMQLISRNEMETEEKLMILKDAIGGFIKSLEEE